MADLFSELVSFTRAEVDRFWSHVDRRDSSECWNWTAYTGKRHLYGQMRLTGRGGKMVRAPKFSWILHNGLIPNGLYILHTCDNPKCVNPNHLFLGDQKANMDDMKKKGRDNKAKGEKTGKAKLTSNKIIEIRGLFESGISRKDIAYMFNVSYSLIKQIIQGKVWNHVK
jgi:hypothetical protein